VLYRPTDTKDYLNIVKKYWAG